MKASDLFDLTGRVALVTGASSGLGVRFAQVLAANGAAVALVARRAERLAAVKADIERAGGRAVALEADVLDRAAMARAFDAAEAAFGTVTILVNNAGVAHGGRAVELPEAEWRRVIGTNLDAVFFCAQEAARRMLDAGKRGAIVNIASILGYGVHKGVVAYATAKAGVIQLTKVIAVENAQHGVRANALLVGATDTDLVHRAMAEFGPEAAAAAKDGRVAEALGPLLLKPEGVAGAVLTLCAESAREINGAEIAVDRGLLAGTGHTMLMQLLLANLVAGG
jgi:3-oxoacyl-[acyl-carrier protein] reductase